MLFKDIKCPNCDTYHDPTLQECPDCHNSNELFKLNRLSKRIIFLHPIAQGGLFLAGFAYTGMLLAEIIATLLAALFARENKALFNTLSITLTYSFMFIGLMLIVLLTRRKLFLSKYKNGIDYVYGLAYALSIVCISIILSSIISLFYEVADSDNQTVVVSIIHNYPILAFIVIGILGPVCEELTYRVGLYSFLRRINKYLAFAVTAIVFALIHFGFDSENMINELWNLPVYIINGLILTIAYEHRGPACSMTAHAIYNTISFLIVLVGKTNGS